jgi:hypothetical protein
LTYSAARAGTCSCRDTEQFVDAVQNRLPDRVGFRGFHPGVDGQFNHREVGRGNPIQDVKITEAGEAGIIRMLELLEDEVIRCLGLLGVTSFAELDKSYLHAATPTNLPHVFSAFPLLDMEPYRY